MSREGLTPGLVSWPRKGSWGFRPGLPGLSTGADEHRLHRDAPISGDHVGDGIRHVVGLFGVDGDRATTLRPTAVPHGALEFRWGLSSGVRIRTAGQSLPPPHCIDRLGCWLPDHRTKRRFRFAREGSVGDRAPHPYPGKNGGSTWPHSAPKPTALGKYRFLPTSSGVRRRSAHSSTSASAPTSSPGR